MDAACRVPGLPSVRFAGCCLLAALACLTLGCAMPSYQYGQQLRTLDDYQLPPDEEQIVRGKPQVVVDSVGWVFGIPSKIMLWNSKMDNHDISPETEDTLQQYLAKNDLENVKVRLNQYDPMGEWRRLRRTQQVGAGWRYTLGTLSLVGYTLLPGRVFGGDNYNPFTNTISIYSDHPGVVLHEGGHAKDFAQREWKGTYAALYLLPGGTLNHEAIATSDALSYLEAEEQYDLQAEAYKVLYPAYGTYVGSTINSVFKTDPYSLAVSLGCLLPGHVIGRIKANESEDKQHFAETRRKAARDLSQNAELPEGTIRIYQGHGPWDQRRFDDVPESSLPEPRSNLASANRSSQEWQANNENRATGDAMNQVNDQLALAQQERNEAANRLSVDPTIVTLIDQIPSPAAPELRRFDH